MKLNILHKTPVITCPHCGAEYLPGEIYIPGAIIGQPSEVVRDSLGKIIYEDYETPDTEPTLTEHFMCEYCDKPFVIEAIVSYKSKEEATEKDFTTKYVSLLD